LYGGIVKTFGHPFAVGLVSDLFADVGQIIGSVRRYYGIIISAPATSAILQV
jgi:hypothetical protein